ncbi:MAG: protein translocase subunit SecF [Armatimonadota bacterium]|nr:MAG: protein translocase subunit SecF [Armatimonadota bacterium]
MVELFRGRKWDLVGRRNYWFALSFVIIATGLYFLITNRINYGQALNYGIDFIPGGQLSFRVEQSFTQQEIAPALAGIRRDAEALGITAEIQIAGSPVGPKNEILMRTKTATTESAAMNDEIQDQAHRMLAALEKRYPGAELMSTEMVGPVISRELIAKAIWAVTIGLALVLLWIVIRYDFKFAVCAIAALVHDVLVLLGAFAILHREINSPFVAVVLTVVGYSVHDTVVIFDRIRENLRLRKGATFAETTNISLLETMARSVNTVLTVLFTVVALYFLGGTTLRDFALGLIIGMVAGTYSSIFNASQLLVWWKQREEPGRKPAAAGPATPPKRVEPERPVAAPVAAPESEEPAPASRPTPAAEERASSSSARSRAKSKKKGKRKRRY